MSPYSLLKPQLIEASSYRAISSANPFWYGNLIHLYLELKLGLDLEGAGVVQNARKAQKYIRRAAEAAQVTCDVFNGQVLEIHGRTLHLGLEYGDLSDVAEQMNGAAGLLHVLLKRVYGSGGPSGWKMAADHGMTLTVQSVGMPRAQGKNPLSFGSDVRAPGGSCWCEQARTSSFRAWVGDKDNRGLAKSSLSLNASPGH